MSFTELPIAELRESAEALRTVNKETEEYEGLKDSISTKGFNGAITVRSALDAETQQTYYEVVDGAHRFNACRDLGMETISCKIVEFDDDDALEFQIMANVHKVETKPAEYSKQLRRILDRRPTLTEPDLAAQLGKSPSWLSKMLKLNKITNARVRTLINEGQINLTNAYGLAGLPEEEIENFIDLAITETPEKFTPLVGDRIKEIRDARRKGENAAPIEFSPTAVMRKAAELKDELESGAVAAGRADFTAAIEWVLSLDEASVAAQKQAWEDRQAAKEAAKKRRQQEKAAKKAEATAKAAEEAAAVAAELGIAD